MLTENDVELKLLAGSPIDIDRVGALHPFKLEEIVSIGEQQYNKYLFLATFKQDDIVIEEHTLTPFESLLIYAYRDDEFLKMYLESMSLLFREEIHFHTNGFFYLGNLDEQRFIHADNYSEIVSVIQKQNFIKEQVEDSEEFKPHDEAAERLIEKLKQFRQKVKEQNKENGLNLQDIISIVASYSGNINMFNVFQLTVFQLYTIYIRLMMKDNYESQLYLLPHSSEPKSSELIHWATKVQ